MKKKWNYPRLAIPLALLLTSLLAVAFYSYRLIDREMTRAVFAQQDAMANLSATVMKERFDRLRDLGVSFSLRRALIQSIRDENWAEVEEILKEILILKLLHF